MPPWSSTASPAGTSDSGLASSYWLEDEAFVEDVREAIRLMYNQQPAASRRVLHPWLEQQPEHPLGAFWDGLELWWYILADLENEAFDDAFITYMEEANQKADRLLRGDRQHFDGLVLKALSNAFLARMYANRERWYKAFRSGRLAFNLLNTIERQYEEVAADAAFGFGLYSYFTAYLQDEYRLVRAISWMLPDGNRELGLRRLEKAAQDGIFLKPEATYFLGHVYLHYERDPDRAEPHLSALQEHYVRNGFFNRLVLRAYFRQRRYTEAKELTDALLQEYEKEIVYDEGVPQSSPEFMETARENAVLATLEELHTMRGQIYYQTFSFGEAVEAFEEVRALETQLAGAADRRHQRMATYQLGRSHLRTGNIEAARPLFEALKARDKDDGFTERAETQLRRIPSP